MDNTDAEGEQARSDLITLKEVYFLSVVMSPKSIPQFRFYEDTSVSSGMDRCVLLGKDHEPAIFQVTGKLTHLSITAAGAVKNRRLESKIDDHTARLRIEEEKHLQEVNAGFDALIDLLKNNAKACENIAVGSGLIETRLKFKQEDVVVKVSNYSNDIFYFNRKVATRGGGPVGDGETPDFMLHFPRQAADFPALRYPTGWNLNPLVPITDRDAIDLQPETIELPRKATVYFEIKQGCYNFQGKEAPVKQIVLIPSIIAIKVHPPLSKELIIARKAKRRRVSCGM